jgi:hypothetical protein
MKETKGRNERGLSGFALVQIESSPSRGFEALQPLTIPAVTDKNLEVTDCTGEYRRRIHL